eukprot:CAMPEP_0176033906 /NCGR_PEP_ID=MMETSP0120_2-20121206/16754_1 /TAXON_ID=160619 /ORGANISM="Kryptoperidinium foliaceum, Strain CCMP 1326" /LENGTH=203 /DNA_ID=CAMNT_0017367241 /DNA_START=184 /DNA_END=792 /DNA_ORIENTATION=+
MGPLDLLLAPPVASLQVEQHRMDAMRGSLLAIIRAVVDQHLRADLRAHLGLRQPWCRIGSPMVPDVDPVAEDAGEPPPYPLPRGLGDLRMPGGNNVQLDLGQRGEGSNAFLGAGDDLKLVKVLRLMKAIHLLHGLFPGTSGDRPELVAVEVADRERCPVNRVVIGAIAFQVLSNTSSMSTATTKLDEPVGPVSTVMDSAAVPV